jgi:replicative DNA helicase
MSIDLKLCGKILELDDLDKIVDSDIEVSDLQGDGRDAYEFITNYYTTYNEFPDEDTIKDEIDVEVRHSDDALEYLVDKIKKRKGRNIGVQGVDQALQKAEDDDISGMKQDLKKTLSQLNKLDVDEGGRVVDFGDFTEERMEHYRDLKTKVGPEGIITPWETVNNCTDAWRDGNTNLIVARSGVGKTWLWIRSYLEAYYEGYTVLAVTTEMTRKEIGRRTDAIHAGIPYQKLKDGELNFEEEKRLQDKMQEFVDNPGLKIVSNGFASSVVDIDMLISEYDPDIVFIDGIYLVEPSVNYNSMTEKLNKTSSELKLTALRQDIPFVSTHQLNRDGADGEITLQNLAYSDKLGWDASIVLAIDQDDDLENRNEYQGDLVKTRDGIQGDFRISADFEAMDFEEIDDEVLEDIPDDDMGQEPDDTNEVGGEVAVDY